MPTEPPLWSRTGIHLRWRADSINKPNGLYVGNLYVGGIAAPRPGDDETHWRARLITDRTTYHATEAEARTALERAAVKALMGENN